MLYKAKHIDSKAYFVENIIAIQGNPEYFQSFYLV